MKTSLTIIPLSRSLADIFRQLPDEGEYADYYDAIPEPESLDNVAVGMISQETPETLKILVVDTTERRILLDGSSILQAAPPRLPQRKALFVVLRILYIS